MKDLLIFPFSGTAIEAIDCLNDDWNFIGFISDDSSVIGKKFFGIEVLSRQAFRDYPNAYVLAVHGSPTSFKERTLILNSLNIDPKRFATLIHNKASVSTHALIGINVLIMAGAVITTNAVIGDHVVVLPNTVIHHDSVIGDYTLIAANVTVAGGVLIGNNCYLGAASSYKNGITIGQYSLVGIGANVINSFSEKSKLVGNPAFQKN